VSRTRLTVAGLGVKAPTAEELKRAAAERELARQTQGLASIIGQQATVRHLCDFALLYAESGAAPVPGHVLLTGADGMGKHTIARAFALDCCRELTVIDAKEQRTASELMGILTNLAQGDALLIRDIPRIRRVLIDMLADALKEFSLDYVVDRGMFAKTINVPLKRFTCVATAPSGAKCPADLIEAFPLVLSLQDYSQTELVSICQQLGQRKGITIAPGAAALVAGASEGSPHRIEVLADRLGALGRTTISEEDVAQVSRVLGFSTGSPDSASPGEIGTLSGVDFEKVIAILLRKMGFQTETTEVTGDGGVDIVATLDRPLVRGRYLIQCKRFAPGKLVGAATVRDFYGALTADHRAVKGILISTSGFTSQALAFAQQLPLELIGGQQLRQLLAQYGISIEIQSAPQALFE
jgi:Holliday junction resolvasome RuvABC ATP-dependent DNA helicase subunit